MLPDVVNISDAKLHDRHGLEQLIFPKNTFIIEDRAYFDFTLMLNRIAAGNIFITRIKTNTVYETIEELELPEGKNEHIVKDEIIRVITSYSIHYTKLYEKIAREKVIFSIHSKKQKIYVRKRIRIS